MGKQTKQYKRKKHHNKSRKRNKKQKGGTTLTYEIAINIWSGETYEYIQEYLKTKNHKTILYDGNEYSTPQIVSMLQQQMVPMKKIRKDNYVFYRGDRNSFLTEASYNKRTFISVSTDKERAQSYMNESNILYTIEVDDNVYCLRTGIEKEYLIDVNSCWIYKGNRNVLITERDDNYPFYDELIHEALQEIQEASDLPVHAPIVSNNDIQPKVIDIQPKVIDVQPFMNEENISDYVDEFNLSGKDDYNYDDFVEELRQLPGIQYENGTEMMLWKKYQELV
jgi:hypothetical protein